MCLFIDTLIDNLNRYINTYFCNKFKYIQKHTLNTTSDGTLIHKLKVSISFHVMSLFIDTLIDKLNHTLNTLCN